MLFLCLSLSDFADISQVVIAVANLILVIYVFAYTRNKDQKDILRNYILQEQQINLQWFKELLIQPNLQLVFDFYERVTTAAEGLLRQNLTDAEKMIITNAIKEQQTKIRKSFVDILRVADSSLELKVKTNLDQLVDDLTVTIFDQGINLSHPPAFEKEIMSKIIYSKNNLMSLIYGFKGTPTKA